MTLSMTFELHKNRFAVFAECPSVSMNELNVKGLATRIISATLFSQSSEKEYISYLQKYF